MDTARLVGEQIDQYHIKSHIARGGMADVYLAQDVDLERNVAFKVMLDLLATDEQYVRRFKREARTVARLDHPNIVQVFSTGQTPLGQPYIAMQFIEGGSLREKLLELASRHKLLTTEQVLNIMRQIAIALGVAHQADVVHRDLKPGNVLIRPDGMPILVDLGIAAVRTEAKLTHTGGFVGTPAYMSPEQIRSQPLDGRSDLYSLGIIFYELFAGERPFDAEDVTAVMFKQVHEEPTPLEQLRPDLSQQTLTIVETLLKKDPEHRYPSAEAVVQAIDAAILAEGAQFPNPQATQILTQLDDSELMSRGSILKVITHSTTVANATAKKVPTWLWAGLLLIIGAAAAIFFLLPDDKSKPNSSETAVSNLPSRGTDEDEPPADKPTIPPTLAETATAGPQPTTITVVPSTETPLPSATPTPAPTDLPPPTPTATPTAVCVGALPTRLTLGGRAQVINYQINVRAGPGVGNSIVNTLIPGREVAVIAGPECTDGQLWYLISSDPFVNSAGDQIQVEGWAVEESDDEYFLEPIGE